MQNNEASRLKEVIQKEYDTLLTNRTWKLVKRLTNQCILRAKLAFKCKQDIDNNIKRYKICWVTRDFEQCEDIDYFKTFVAVVKSQTNKILFAMTVKKKLHFYQINIITAFLNSQFGKRI